MLQCLFQLLLQLFNNINNLDKIIKMLLYHLLIKKEKFVNRATVLLNVEFTQATRGF